MSNPGENYVGTGFVTRRADSIARPACGASHSVALYPTSEFLKPAHRHSRNALGKAAPGALVSRWQAQAEEAAGRRG